MLGVDGRAGGGGVTGTERERKTEWPGRWSVCREEKGGALFPGSWDDMTLQRRDSG